METEKKDFGLSLYVVLEMANLETALLKNGPELVNGEEHSRFVENKLKGDKDAYRPDVTH